MDKPQMPDGKSMEPRSARKEKPEKNPKVPWSVYVRTIVYEQSDDHVVSTGTSGMKREYTIDD